VNASVAFNSVRYTVALGKVGLRCRKGNVLSFKDQQQTHNQAKQPSASRRLFAALVEKCMAENVVSVQLDWSYSPATYLEEPISLPFDGGIILINDGKAVTVLEPSFFEANKNIG